MNESRYIIDIFKDLKHINFVNFSDIFYARYSVLKEFVLNYVITTHCIIFSTYYDRLHTLDS